MATQLSDSEIRTLLETERKIAVIGLSPVPARPSYGVTRYMIENGYEVFGIRPASPPSILGRPCFESLAELDANVGILNVFRNSEALPDLVFEIEAWMKTRAELRMQKPKVLWLQEGISHPEAESRAEKLGLKVIANRCILKEHARLL